MSEGHALERPDVGQASDEDRVFETPVGASSHTIGPRGASLNLLGLIVMALPPGRVHATIVDTPPMLNIMPAGASHTDVRLARIDGVDHDVPDVLHDSFVLHRPVGTMEFDGLNYGWECLVEMDPARLPFLASEAMEGEVRFGAPITIGRDPVLSQLATVSIDHLREADGPDRLFVEGLAISMTARAFGLTDVMKGSIATRGTDDRIARAIDFAEAHLDEPLSIADLAAVAGMSPSWFRDCFRVATGMPVHAYVRERRLQRVRRLLTEAPRVPLATRPSIQQVAHACGFADQSHLTRAFKRRFGVTPGETRAMS
ncbi:MAG: AraC family transcriptional regulator [Pseudomonadota bacterium]